MKRLLVASAIATSLIAATTSAVRAGGQSTGAAQIQWTTAASASLSIATQYASTGAQGNALPTLLASFAGTCFASTAEVNFTLSFGSLAPRSGSPVGCLYKNAIAIGVQTNDAAGFSVNQYIDVPLSNGVGVCAYPNGGGGAFPEAPAVAPVTASTQSGSPPAGTYSGNVLTSCPGAGQPIPTGTGGVDSNGTVPGNPGTPGLEYYSGSTAFLTLMSSTGPTVSGGSLVTMYGAEDIQMNLGPGTKSMPAGVIGDFITFQLIAN